MHIGSKKAVSLVIGPPGSGKSTYICKLASEAYKKDIPVYCNYPLLGSYYIDDMSKLIDYDFGESVLLIDEAGLHYFSRNTKAFTNEHNNWFSTTRHRGTQIYFVVQAWGRVDVILRQLATEIILVKKSWFGFSRTLHYDEDIKLVENDDGYAVEFLEVFNRFGRHYFRRKKYYHMFDSYFIDREYKKPDFEKPDSSLFPKKKSIFDIFRKEGKRSVPSEKVNLLKD